MNFDDLNAYANHGFSDWYVDLHKGRDTDLENADVVVAFRSYVTFLPKDCPPSENEERAFCFPLPKPEHWDTSVITFSYACRLQRK